MNSAQLADEVETLVRNCRERVMGVGDEQYSEGDTQKFERLPLTSVVDYALEEVEDIVNYAAMLHIRLRRLKAVIAERADV